MYFIHVMPLNGPKRKPKFDLVQVGRASHECTLCLVPGIIGAKSEVVLCVDRWFVDISF